MKPIQAMPQAKGSDSAANWANLLFWPLATAWLMLRLWFNARCDLVPDEAFYWTWTRHLDLGYFDHPPMIAWLMSLSTRALGDTGTAVRLPAALMSFGSLIIVRQIARLVLSDARAVGAVVLMWIAGPLLAVTGTIHTPDASATFFSICALYFAVRAIAADDPEKHAAQDPRLPAQTDRTGNGRSNFSSRPIPTERPFAADDAQANPSPSRPRAQAKDWLFFGLFCGLGLLSKYTSVLLPFAVAMFLCTSRPGRRHLKRPWIYLAALIALTIFSPDLYWNQQHHWASFLFQLNHGAGGGIAEKVPSFGLRLLTRAVSLLSFTGGQLVVWTPILFGMAILVLCGYWLDMARRAADFVGLSLGSPGKIERLFGPQRYKPVDSMLVWTGTMPLLVFGLASTQSHSEINWPAFAYFPLSLLIARYLSDSWRGARLQWFGIGWRVAIGFTIGVHLIAIPAVQQIASRHVHLTHQITDLWGWRQFGRQLAQKTGDLPVVCARHQDAGECSFYMPGHPEVWCESRAIGSRPTAFDYFDKGRPDYAKLPRVVFVGDGVDRFMSAMGYHAKLDVVTITAMTADHRVRTATIVGR